MPSDLSQFPIMDNSEMDNSMVDPGIDVGDSFKDFDPEGSASLDAWHWDDIWGAISSPAAKNLMSLASGAYGLYESGQQRNLARDALKAGDPFGPYRAQYAQKLMALMNDPSSITKEPGYQFQFDQGQQAVERGMAAKGYLGSGNEGIALEQYGQNFAKSAYNDRLAQLAGLAGANIAPNQGPGLNEYNAGLETASASLASLGYGLTRGGSSAGTPGSGGKSGPSAASGEAAKVGAAAGLVGAGAGLANKLSGGSETAQGVSTAAGKVGDLASIYTGIDKGGVKGYGQAAAGIADLAGYNIKGAPVFAVAGAVDQAAKGDVPGAAISLVSAAVPVAGVGFAAASLANKAFFGDKTFQRNSQTWLNDIGAQQVTMGRNLSVIKLPDGRVIPAGSVKDISAAYFSAAYEGGDPSAYYNALKGLQSMQGVNLNAKALQAADTSKGNIYGKLSGPG